MYVYLRPHRKKKLITLFRIMDRLARLYPKVDEKETPLPRSWSVKDKFSFLVLSQNNQKVHYKGTIVTQKLFAHNYLARSFFRRR